jgi:prevent-host-death family protein
MTTIPLKELRNNVSEILRRAEAGEEFEVTVSGRPVARLGPLTPKRRTWIPLSEVRELLADLPPWGTDPGDELGLHDEADDRPDDPWERAAQRRDRRP